MPLFVSVVFAAAVAALGYPMMVAHNFYVLSPSNRLSWRRGFPKGRQRSQIYFAPPPKPPPRHLLGDRIVEPTQKITRKLKIGRTITPTPTMPKRFLDMFSSFCLKFCFGPELDPQGVFLDQKHRNRRRKRQRA